MISFKLQARNVILDLAIFPTDLVEIWLIPNLTAIVAPPLLIGIIVGSIGEMTSRKLRKVMACNDLDPELSSKLPRLQCIVYSVLGSEERGMSELLPIRSGRLSISVYSHSHCNMDQQRELHSLLCIGLFLGMQEKGSVLFAVDYEFSARLMSLFPNIKGTTISLEGYRNLIGTTWTSFMAEDSQLFINGIASQG